MAILVEVRRSRDEPWQFEGLYGHPDDEITMVPAPGTAPFDEYVARIEGKEERVVICGHHPDTKLKIRLNAQDAWTCPAISTGPNPEKLYIKITDLDITHLTLLECPVCHEMIRPFELKGHGRAHSQRLMDALELSHEEHWLCLYRALAEYIAAGSAQGKVALGLCCLAERIEAQIQVAEAFGPGLQN